MSVVPLADVKAYLGVSDAAHDTVLQGLIDAAEAIIARRVGPLTPTSVTQRAPGARPALMLNTRPVISIQSITDSMNVTLSMTGMDSDIQDGIVRFSPYTGMPFVMPWYTITYTAGWATLPADLILAIKELVRHLWQTQRVVTARPGQGSDIPGASHALPYRVEELIAPYMSPGFA